MHLVGKNPAPLHEVPRGAQLATLENCACWQMQALSVMPIDGAPILAPGTLWCAVDCCHDPFTMYVVEVNFVKRFPGQALVGLNADYAEHC